MTHLKKEIILGMSLVAAFTVLSGCSQQETSKQEPTSLSSKEVQKLFKESDKAIDDHQYKDAMNTLEKIEKEAEQKEAQQKAKMLKNQLTDYTKAYQLTLDATDGKESKEAGKQLVDVIKKDQKSSVAKLAIQTLSQYQKTADLYPGNLTLAYNKMVIAKKNNVKKYDKAELSSKSKKLTKNESFRAQDICYIDGTPYYALYLDDKKHNNSLKKVGYGKVSDFETVEGKAVNKVKTVKKTSHSHLQFIKGDNKEEIKKNKKYYVTYEYKVDGKTIYSINRVDKKGKPIKEDGKYYWAGYIDSHSFK